MEPTAGRGVLAPIVTLVDRLTAGQSVLNPIMWLVDQPAVPWVLVIVLFALTVFWVIRLWTRLAAFDRSVELSRILVERSPNAREFAASFETINESIARDRYLGHDWQAYAETVLWPKGHVDRVRNTIRPEFFFNDSLLDQAGINVRFYQSVPNFLVGGGLLFTFVGLTAALYFAAAAVASTNVGQAQRALQGLLNAASFKFITSLFGLAFSIAFSILEKRMLHRTSAKLSNLCRQLEKRMDFSSDTMLSDERLTEARKQTSILEFFKTDLAMAIGDAINDRMAENLNAAMAPMILQVTQMASKMGEMNQEALTSMVTQFSDRLGAEAAERMKAMADTIAQVDQSLGGMINAVGNAAGTIERQGAAAAAQLKAHMEDGASEISGRLKDAADVSGKLIEDRIGAVTQRIADVLNPLGDRLAAVSTTLETLPRQLQDQQRSLSGLLQGMDHASAVLTTAAGNISSAVDPLVAVSNGLRQAIEGMDRLSGDLSNAGAQIANASQQLGETTSTVTQTWSSYRQHFDGLDEQMQRVFASLSTGLAGFVEQIEQFIGKMDEDMAGLAKRIEDAIEELSGTLEDFLERRDDLEKALAEN